MPRNGMFERNIFPGFTAAIVLSIPLGIYFAITACSFIQCRGEPSIYQSSVDNILHALRDAKNLTIASNWEHRVEFETFAGRYRITRGDRAYDSIDWSTVVSDWTQVPQGVRLDVNVQSIQIKTNGTANGGCVKVQDADRRTRYEILVTRTGRVKVPLFF